MVAPYEHVAALPELDGETVAEMMGSGAAGDDDARATYAPHGYNVGFNQGRVAGAGVEHHIHMHVVPRWGGDTNFMPVLADTRVMPQTLEQSYEALAGRRLLMAITVPRLIFKAYDVRGIYGEEMDGETAYLIGRAFARVLADLRERPGRASGRPRPRHAPERAGDGGARREGSSTRGPRARRRPGRPPRCSTSWSARASSTAARWSPLPTTRRRTPVSSCCARARWRCRATPASGMSAPQIEAGLPDPPGGGTVEGVDIGEEFHEHLLALVDPDRIKPAEAARLRRQRHGRSDDRARAGRLDLELRTAVLGPDGDFPEHEPNPMLEENRAEIIERVRERRSTWHRLGRRRRPLLLLRLATPSSAMGTSSARCWPRRCWQGARAR